MTFDGITAPVGGAGQLATMFDEELAALPGPGLLLAAGDNVGASPPNSALLEDMPAIDVENAWGLDATVVRQPRVRLRRRPRLQAQQAQAHFPFLATNIVETATGKAPSWVKPSVVFNVNGIRVGVIGAELQNTPELVSAGNTAGLTFLPEAERIKAESERLRKQGVKVQVVVIHQGTNVGTNTLGNTPGHPMGRADHRHRRRPPGHDRRRDDRRAHPPGLEPDGRRHPRDRGRQRRRELLRRSS